MSSCLGTLWVLLCVGTRQKVPCVACLGGSLRGCLGSCLGLLVWLAWGTARGLLGFLLGLACVAQASWHGCHDTPGCKTPEDFAKSVWRLGFKLGVQTACSRRPQAPTLGASTTCFYVGFSGLCCIGSLLCLLDYFAVLLVVQWVGWEGSPPWVLRA